MKTVKTLSLYLLLSITIIYIIKHSSIDLGTVISEMNTSDFILYSILILLSSIQTIIFMKLNLSIVGIKENNITLFYYSQATNLLNYLPLKAGVLMLATFLKKKHNLKYHLYVLITVINYAFISASSFLILVILIFSEKSSTSIGDIRVHLQKIFSSSGSSIVIGVIFILFLLIVYYMQRHKIKAFLKNYKLVNKKIVKALKSKLFLFNYSLQSFLQIFLFALRMYFAFKLAGVKIDFVDAVMIGVLANFSFIISITPGAIGIKEGIVGFMSYLLTGNAEIGILASLIDRSMMLIWTVILGSISVRQLGKSISQKNIQPPECSD